MAKLKSGTRIYGTATIDTSVVVGSAVTLNSSGVTVAGIVTATSFRGDGSQLIGIVATGIGTLTQLSVSGVSTFSGISTFQASLFGTQASFTGVSTFAGITTVTGSTLFSRQISVSGVTTSGGFNATTGNTYQIAGTTVLNNNTLGSGVVNSSLTSVGTLGQLNVSGVSTFAGIATHTASLFGTQASFTGVSTFGSSLTVNAGMNVAQGGSGAFSFLGTNSNFTVAAQTTGAITLGGSSQTGAITLGQATTSQTTNIQAGASGVGTTKIINLGTGGLSGSFTQIHIGPTAGVGTVTINSGTNVGLGTTSATQPLHVQGNARVTGAIYDSTNSPGTSGQVLQSTVTGTQWTTAAASGGGSGKFDTSIDNVLYIQPTGTLDAVGVGTTVTQITTLPSTSPEYIIHSIHVTNISNGDAEITAGFIVNARRVPASISVSAGSSGGAGIHTFTVGSASSITVGMAVTGTGNIGETTGIGTTAGFQFNTYVTSVDGNNITLSKPMSGRAVGTLQFSPVSKVSSRLPVPVGSAVELLKQPMILNALDSIVLQSTGAGSGIGSTSTNAISQTATSNTLTVTAGAAITNFLTAGMLVQPTGINTGIQTNTFVGVGYVPGSLSIPITRPATTSVASTSYSFTEVVVPQDGALQATIVYQSTTDTSYLNGTGTVVGIVTLASQATSPVLGITSTVPLCYYGTGNSFPSVIQSIRVSNISDGSIYPGGDYPVWVGIGNSDTVFSWLAYNMIVPKNSSIELCEAPKRIGIGQSIFAYSNTPGVIEIQVAGKQKTT